MLILLSEIWLKANQMNNKFLKIVKIVLTTKQKLPQENV